MSYFHFFLLFSFQKSVINTCFYLSSKFYSKSIAVTLSVNLIQNLLKLMENVFTIYSTSFVNVSSFALFHNVTQMSSFLNVMFSFLFWKNKQRARERREIGRDKLQGRAKYLWIYFQLI